MGALWCLCKHQEVHSGKLGGGTLIVCLFPAVPLESQCLDQEFGRSRGHFRMKIYLDGNKPFHAGPETWDLSLSVGSLAWFLTPVSPGTQTPCPSRIVPHLGLALLSWASAMSIIKTVGSVSPILVIWVFVPFSRQDFKLLIIHLAKPRCPILKTYSH